MLPSSEPSLMPSSEPSNEPSLQPSLSPSECEDEEGWIVGGNATQPFAGMKCADIGEEDAETWCGVILKQPNSTYLGKSVDEACCACNGSKFQTIFPSNSPTDAPSVSHNPTIEPEVTSAPSACVDEPGWHFFADEEHQLGCDNLVVNEAEDNDMCDRFKDVFSDGKSVLTACCVCGGGINLSRQPSSAPSTSQAPSTTPSLSNQPSIGPSDIPTSTPTISMEPSSFPSFPSDSSGFVLDGKTCRNNYECLSRVCVKNDEIINVDDGEARPLNFTDYKSRNGTTSVYRQGENTGPDTGLCKTGVSLELFLNSVMCLSNTDVCSKIWERDLGSSDFELIPDKKYFSENRQFYLIFQKSAGKLFLKANDGDKIQWNSPIDNENDPDSKKENKCILQRNGNLVIFDGQMKPVWYSVQNLLEVRSVRIFLEK